MEYFCNIHSQFKGRIISAIFKVNDCFSSCTNKLCQFALFISCLLTNLRKVKFATWEDSSTRFHSLGMTYRGVVPFNSTGYIRTWRAADCRPYGHTGGWYRSTARVVFGALLGDESSPLHCVVPFNHTCSIHNAPGTAHRPFPTVSLVGGTVNRTGCI